VVRNGADDIERLAEEERAVEVWENEGGATASGAQVLPRSRVERLRLQTLFQEVDLPEIQGIDIQAMSIQQIVQLLPAYGTGGRTMTAILLDRQTGRAYGIASGWESGTVTHNGISFRSGAISQGLAACAGADWQRLGFHMEPVAAAFMRRMGIADAVVVINGSNPCYGTAQRPGCHDLMPVFLDEGSRMVVYNKWGQDHTSTNPSNRFRYIGNPD
jgi:hypothetical protein